VRVLLPLGLCCALLPALAGAQVPPAPPAMPVEPAPPAAAATDPYVPPFWVDTALKAKSHLQGIRISGNRGARVNHALFAPAWSRGPDIEQELWVYVGSAWNRVAQVGQIAKKIQLHVAPDALPPDLTADEVQIIVPVRLTKLRAAKDGSGEELLNVALRPSVEPARVFEPNPDYRRLLALPPDWDIRVFAYAPGTVHANSHVEVFYTKTHEGGTIDPNCLRGMSDASH
jgi:hypothetical protein